MTLWSILNDLQEAFYEKTETTWTIKGTADRFLHNKKVAIRYDGANYVPGPASVPNPWMQLHLQIAYLLHKSTGAPPRHLANLHELNQCRNHLYLTHGDNKPEYYKETEKIKSLTDRNVIKPEGKIKELFELVGFLLTAGDIVVPIKNDS
jgi:hypothetical protein